MQIAQKSQRFQWGKNVENSPCHASLKKLQKVDVIHTRKSLYLIVQLIDGWRRKFKEVSLHQCIIF